MNILISGGWGYGNLGDDAILLSTIQLVKQRFKDAKLCILSYDPKSTRNILSSEISVSKSAHRVLYGDSAYKFLDAYGHNYNWKIYPLFVLSVRSRIKKLLPRKKYKFTPIPEDIATLNSCFEKADLYIMSGGGYFNNWEHSTLSKCYELELAKKHGVKAVIYGQSWCSFNEHLKNRVANAMQDVKSVYLRDKASITAAQQVGVNAKYCSDIALSRDLPELTESKQSKMLGFIPAEINRKKRANVADQVAKIAKEHGMAIRIIITRLYNGDIADAQWFYKRLVNNGIAVEMRIPNDIHQISEDFRGLRHIISSNLHGLIIGYTSSTDESAEGNLICINTMPKHTFFMEQIGHKDDIVDTNQMHDDELYECFNRVVAQPQKSNKRSEIREQVRKSFFEMLSEI